jgi:spore coat protein U-like protein
MGSIRDGLGGGVAAAWLVLGVASGAQAADTGPMALSAVVLSKSNCKFKSGSTNVAIDFTSVDPTATGPLTKTTSVSFKCAGSSNNASWSITGNNGQHYSSGLGMRRMQHSTVATEFLPYSLNVPASGTAAKNADVTVTITATLAAADYQNARMGTYSDTVQLTLSP